MQIGERRHTAALLFRSTALGSPAWAKPLQGAWPHPVGVAEQLAHHEPAARPDHAAQFAQRLLLVGNLAQDGDHEGSVELSIAIGQRLGVAAHAHDIV